MKMLCEQTDEEHTLTVEQIIEGLEQYGISAERKSIYADIETLKNFGIDVESKREKHTGYYVASRDFELPELKLLVDAVQSSKFITEKKSRELIRKIERLTGKYEAQKLERQVNVADRIKHMNESIYYSVDQIHTAISENKKVSFRYFELNEKKERVMKRGGDAYTVSPYSLVWDDENYYLVGMDDLYGERRHYRVDKMSRLTVTDDERNMSCDAGESGSYSKKLFGMFGGTEASVTLSCENSLAGVILDRFGRETVFRLNGTDHFEFTVTVVISDMFYSWLASFGGKIRLLFPENVRERYAEFIEKAKNVL